MSPPRSIRPIRATALVVALGIAPTIVAQWQVDHRVPGGISGMGTMRYVQTASRALPSESRFERMSSGLLPSENRMRYLDSGPGLSHARLASPIRSPISPPHGVYDPLSSIRYGSMTPGTAPPPAPRSYAPPISVAGTGTRAVFQDVPSSIRYGGAVTPPLPAPRQMDWGRTTPIAAPSPYGSPGSIRYASRFP